MPSFDGLVPNDSTYLRLPRRFAPRNDKSGVHAGLTVARSERQCLPEIATSASGLLAMTRQGNTAVHQRLSAVELHRTGRSVSALQAGNIQGMYFMA